ASAQRVVAPLAVNGKALQARPTEVGVQRILRFPVFDRAPAVRVGPNLAAVVVAVFVGDHLVRVVNVRDVRPDDHVRPEVDDVRVVRIEGDLQFRLTGPIGRVKVRLSLVVGRLDDVDRLEQLVRQADLGPVTAEVLGDVQAVQGTAGVRHGDGEPPGVVG